MPFLTHETLGLSYFTFEERKDETMPDLPKDFR